MNVIRHFLLAFPPLRIGFILMPDIDVGGQVGTGAPRDHRKVTLTLERLLLTGNAKCQSGYIAG